MISVVFLFFKILKQSDCLNKMLINKKSTIAAVTMATASLIFTFAAFAQDNNSEDSSHSDESKSETSMQVNINPVGRVNLRGTVDSVKSAVMTVKSWGGTWTVNLSSTTKLVRRFGGTSNTSEIQSGDMVGVEGKISTVASWTIDATNVRDSSIQTRNASFFGTISNLSGSSFTLTTKEKGAVKVTVNLVAKIIVDGKASQVSDLANGMQASVGGVWDRMQSTVLADKVQAKTPGVSRTSIRGTISNITSNSFTLTTNKVETVQVTVGTGTKVIVDGNDASVSSLVNGMKAGVSGLANKTTMTLVAEKIVANTTNSGKNEEGSNPLKTNEGGR